MTDKEIINFGNIYSLYKNRDYSYETIYNGEIFLAYPNTFNDPYDCFIMVNESDFELEYVKGLFGEKVIDEELIAKSKTSGIIDTIARLQYVVKYEFAKVPRKYDVLLLCNTETLARDCSDLFNKYCGELEKLRNRYGMACFTTNRPQNNLAMWAHYADNYKGFCCKFNFGNVKRDIDRRIDSYAYNLLKNIKKVKYVSKFPQIDVKKLLKIPVEQVYNDTYVNNFIKSNLNKKYIQWKYENEYRLIIDREDSYFTKKSEIPEGFTIEFNFLKELYMYSNTRSLQKELIIAEIARKFNVKYLTLTISRGSLELVEDTKTINKHNQRLDLEKVFNDKI